MVWSRRSSSTFTYFGNLDDRRLQTIHHKNPGGGTFSKFDYTYDKSGNVLTWQQQAGEDQPVLWHYAYDAADQLVSAAKWTTSGTPTILKRYSYGYDLAGNRTTEQIDDAATLSTYDMLNRLVSQQAGGQLRVAGSSMRLRR